MWSTPFSCWVALFPIGPSGAGLARFANSDDGHHASRVPVGGAMGEKQVLLALCATAHNLNGSRREAAVEQLAAVGLDKIHV